MCGASARRATQGQHAVERQRMPDAPPAADAACHRGRHAERQGGSLIIAGDNTEWGISFMNTANKTITKLSPGDIVINEPSRLLILVPTTLAPGEYQLSITTQFSGGANLLKQPRNISYDTPIIIA